MWVSKPSTDNNCRATFPNVASAVEASIDAAVPGKGGLGLANLASARVLCAALGSAI